MYKKKIISNIILIGSSNFFCGLLVNLRYMFAPKPSSGTLDYNVKYYQVYTDVQWFLIRNIVFPIHLIKHCFLIVY